MNISNEHFVVHNAYSNKTNKIRDSCYKQSRVDKDRMINGCSI